MAPLFFVHLRGDGPPVDSSKGRLAVMLLGAAEDFSGSTTLDVRFRTTLFTGMGSANGLTDALAADDRKELLLATVASSTDWVGCVDSGSDGSDVSFDRRRERRNVWPSRFFEVASLVSLASLLDTSP